jgi:hypothetical protein
MCGMDNVVWHAKRIRCKSRSHELYLASLPDEKVGSAFHIVYRFGKGMALFYRIHFSFGSPSR